MKNWVIAIVLLTTTFCFSQKKPKIEGSKNVVDTEANIKGSFNVLEVNDDFEVFLSQGSNNHYKLTADDNLANVVKIEVKDSVLKLYTDHKISSSKKFELYLTIEGLEHLIIKNDARVQTTTTIQSKKLYISGYNSSKFDLNIESEDLILNMHRNAGGKISVKSVNTTIAMNDRTDLKAEIDTDKLRTTLNNSAQLTVEGKTDHASINLKKTSELKAKKFTIGSADLYTSNSSDIDIKVRRNLEVYAQGKSKIYVYGDPNIEIKGLTDKSKIIKK